MVTASLDSTTRIWDTATGKELCALISFKDGTWAVVDPEGRYDASNGGDIEGLHWVYSDPKNHILEPIELRQFKDLYYDPGLLAKKLGFSPEKPREVPEIKAIKLYPTAKATLSADGKTAKVSLEECAGGGIGSYKVFLNGAQIHEGKAPPGVARHSFDLDLSPFEKRLIPKPELKEGQENRLEVFAYNAANSLSSRSVGVTMPAPPTSKGGPPKLYILAAGCSDYEGTTLDLKYAAKDAVAFAKALSFAARNLLGEDRVEVTILATDRTTSAYPDASNANIRAALEAIAAKAEATDTVIVYLSGHGVSKAGEDSDYYYLTKEAGLIEIDRPETRGQISLSGDALSKLLAQIPANKQVLILDTCGSGAAAQDLTKGRDVGSDVRRAWERLKDRAGVFVLAGCNANAVSYEASNVRHGLLTYSLLEPLNKVDSQVLKLTPEGNFQIEIMPWLQYSEQRVGELIKELRLTGNQKPELKPAARASSFPVGQLAGTDRDKITLEQPKKVVLLDRFDDEDKLDNYMFTNAMEAALLKASAEGAYGMIYWPTVKDHPIAHVLNGTYSVSGDTVKVTVRVRAKVGPTEETRAWTNLLRWEETGPVADLPKICERILARAGAELWKPKAIDGGSQAPKDFVRWITQYRKNLQPIGANQ